MVVMHHGHGSIKSRLNLAAPIAAVLTMLAFRARGRGRASTIAKATTATDPDRAASLSADAERIAQSISRWRPTGSAARSFLLRWTAKESALGSITEALASTDPDQAKRIAQCITPGPRRCPHWCKSRKLSKGQGPTASRPDGR